MATSHLHRTKLRVPRNQPARPSASGDADDRCLVLRVRQSGGFSPKALSRRVVLRLPAGCYRTAFVEVFARHTGHFG